MKLIAPALATLVALVAVVPVLAHDYKVGPVNIGHPWAGPAAKGGTAAGYLSLTNTGEAPATLSRVEATWAAKAELHESRSLAGVTRMVPLPAGVAAPAGASVKLEPGGKHVMFLGVKQDLKVGDKLPAILVFKDGGRVTVEFAVQPLTAGTGMAGMKH